MSVTCRVIVEWKPDIRQLLFEFEPRAGDSVRLPDLDGDLYYVVDKVIHNARLPHSNAVADALVILVPERPTNAPRG